MDHQLGLEHERSSISRDPNSGVTPLSARIGFSSRKISSQCWVYLGVGEAIGRRVTDKLSLILHARYAWTTHHTGLENHHLSHLIKAIWKPRPKSPNFASFQRNSNLGITNYFISSQTPMGKQLPFMIFQFPSVTSCPLYLGLQLPF